jgi:hypothetical protein
MDRRTLAAHVGWPSAPDSYTAAVASLLYPLNCDVIRGLGVHTYMKVFVNICLLTKKAKNE